MAKCKNPLFSIKAVGSIGKALTYTSSKGVNIVKKFFKSLDRLTDRRIFIRQIFLEGTQAWNALTPTEKQAYVDDAKPKHITGFNLFMKKYLDDNIPPYGYGIYGISTYGSCVYTDD